MPLAFSAELPENPADSVKKATSLLIEQELQCETVTDCVLIPVGARPCGGIDKYLITSKNHTKMEQIKKLSELSTELEKDYIVENALYGICLPPTVPMTACMNEKCVEILEKVKK